MKKIIFIIFMSTLFVSYAQNKQQRSKITEGYNLEKLAELSATYLEQYKTDYSKASKLAIENGWPLTYTDANGSYHELIKTYDGAPVYYSTFNRNASRSTRTKWLNTSGGMGLELNGEDMVAYVWDGGHALMTHNEFSNASGDPSRITIGEGGGGDYGEHATHVCGTVAAYGSVASAKGMAPKVSLVSYDWANDLSEVAAAAADGMLLSNHSYGIGVVTPGGPDIPDWRIGAYTTESYQWDNLSYNAPHYLKVVAAGNDGNNNYGNGDPLDGNTLYDKLIGDCVSKNVLVVAATNDVSVNSSGEIVSPVTIASFSSEGPTDDYRIKPDIAGNGVGVYSSIDSSNSSYASFDGTSMASPNVMGSLLLIQQHYNDINGEFMRASTLKGLVLHTANDAGVEGPDTKFGWGLLNSKSAVETISNNGLNSIIIEDSLNEGDSYSIEVPSNGGMPFTVSISWTDPVATSTINSGVANDTTPVLVNDLDVRVNNGTEYLPWKLTGVTTNTKADNIVDPFEKIDILAASGTYTITVTHKGSLTDGKQDFALIITGVDSEFTFNPVISTLEQCASDDAVFEFDFTTIPSGASSTVTFSSEGLPSGATATFDPPSMTTSGTVNMTISGLIGADPDEYIIDVIAQNSSEIETKQVNLALYNPTITTPTLVYPLNNAIDILNSFELKWDASDNVQSYEILVAEDSDFSSVVLESTTTINSHVIFNLNANTTYYWKVKPINLCGSGDYSATNHFTINNSCSSFSSSSPSAIPDAGANLSTSFIVSEDFTVKDVNLFLDISHQDVNSLLISLKNPEGTTTYVSTPVGDCDSHHVFATFDSDSNTEIPCDEESEIGFYGILQPSGDFSNFNEESSAGEWTLTITDLEPGIIGVLNSWDLSICNEVVTITEEFEIEDFNIWPNPTSGEVTISLLANNTNIVSIVLYDISGRLISEKRFTNVSSNFKESINFGNLSKGIYSVKVSNGNKFSTKKLLIK